MHPVPIRAESARQVGNELLLAQSDSKPAGPPPKNPSGRTVLGALRIGSGEARMQSTVSPGIINPSKYDSPSQNGGQLKTTTPVERAQRRIAKRKSPASVLHGAHARSSTAIRRLVLQPKGQLDRR